MLQITFRNMSSSTAVWDLAKQKLVKLEGQLRGRPFCSLVIAHHASHAKRDAQYCAHVELRLSADQRLRATVEAEHPLSAIRDVFAVLDRRISSRHALVDRAAE